jgi:cytochrome c oxidase assembly factor CtaG/cytochrome c2
MMLLHAGAPLAPHDLWSTWSFEPGVIAPLAITGVIYGRGVKESLARARRSKELVKREMILFTCGFITLTIALVSPVHAAGSALFSAHMIQHELLMAIAAPLLVLGRPGVPLMWGLPISMRRPVGALVSRSPVADVFSLLTRPLVAFLIHGAAIWIWHAPRLYDASVRGETVHVAQHLSFLLTALFFWWSVFHSAERRGGQGFAILYLFLTGVHTTLLGALLTLADFPIYSVYSAIAPTSWGLTALEDQQLGGMIMWVPGSLAYLAAALFLMFGLLRRAAPRVTPASQAIAAIVCVFLISGCTNHDAQWAASLTGGTPSRGRETIRSYGCQSCHTIPGVTGAKALVGPPLGGIASRSYIAGVMSNTPQHMIEWLRNPPGIDSKTAMPNMNVTERDARDIAAYLYTLK